MLRVRVYPSLLRRGIPTKLDGK
eukprot:COSAG02_NODE_82639_length_102_cov_143.333333_1_plen_22_part_01